MRFLDQSIEWDDFYWMGDITSPVFPSIRSSSAQLQVGTKDEEEMPPHDLQIDTWRRLVANPDTYMSQILDGFYEYYLQMRPQYVEAGGDWAKNMPAISSSEEIAPMLRLNAIDIGWPYDGTVILGFSFGCKWDGEHGAGIVFKGGAQIDIGGADCLYCSH